MPLEIHYQNTPTDNLACPHVICDLCGAPVNKEDPGNAEFQEDTTATDLWDKPASQVVFLHKRCSRGYQKAHPVDHPGMRWMWLDLSIFFHHLQAVHDHPQVRL